MSTNVTWNGTTYSIPAAGEVNWASLSNFLIALGNNAAIAQEMKQAVRVATTTPVTVSDTTDCVVATNLSVAGAVAVTLPAGTDGRWFAIVDQRGDGNTNNITITPNGAETINGSATYVINENRGGVILVYSLTNTRWNIVGRFSPGTPLSNPMDSEGDMIYGGVAGVPSKLDSGSTGTLLVSQGTTAPSWTNIVGNATTFSSGVLLSNSASSGTGYTSNSLTALTYEDGTLVTTVSELSSGNAITLKLVRVGRTVSITSVSNPEGTVTGTPAALNLAVAVPVAFRPTVSQSIPVWGKSGSTAEVLILGITSSGFIFVNRTGGGNFSSNAGIFPFAISFYA